VGGSATRSLSGLRESRKLGFAHTQLLAWVSSTDLGLEVAQYSPPVGCSLAHAASVWCVRIMSAILVTTKLRVARYCADSAVGNGGDGRRRQARARRARNH